MSLTFGPAVLDPQVVSEDQVVVTNWDGTDADLDVPVSLVSGNAVTFSVSASGRYIIVVRTREYQKKFNVKLTKENYDPSDMRQYVDAKVAHLQTQINGGGGGEGGSGPKGDSAYEVAVDNGFVGSEAQWLASLKGAKGDPGDDGSDGLAASVSVGTTTTGAAGTNASVTQAGTSTARTFNFTIPRGATGASGAAGVGIQSLIDNNNGTFSLLLTNGTTVGPVEIPEGPAGSAGSTGSAGAAASVSVGSVTTGAVGSNATVTNVGTSSAAILNFSIPRGATGVKGDKGDTGASGFTVLNSTDPAGTDTGVVYVRRP